MEMYDKKYVYYDYADVEFLKDKWGFGANFCSDLKWIVRDDVRTNFFCKCSFSGDISKPFHLPTGENVQFFYYDPNYIVKRAWMNGEEIQMKVDDEWEDFNFKYEKDKDYYKIEWDENEWRVKPIGINSTRSLYMKYDYNTEECDFMISSENFGNIYSQYCKIFSGTLSQCAERKEFYEELISNHKLHCRNCKNSDMFNEMNDKKCHKCESYSNFEEKDEKSKYRRMTNRELSQWLAKGNGEMKKSYSMINGVDFQTTVNIHHSYFETEGNNEVGKGILIREFGSDEWKEPLIEV